MSCQFKDECPSYSGWCEGPKQDYSRCIPFLVAAVQSRDERLKELLERPEPEPGIRVLYRCDRRACKKCSPLCSYTMDVLHAENFQMGETGVMAEVIP